MPDHALPLVDLHRHLDGNIKPELIQRLAQEFNLPLADLPLEEIRNRAQILDKTSDLLAFLAKLDVGVSVLVNQSACYQVAYENMRDAQNEDLDYVELRFSPHYMAMSHNLSLDEVIEATAAGVRDGCRDFQRKANLIGILSRTFGAQTCQEELQAILRHREAFVALDLAGDEINYPAELFENHFQQARDAGLQITVHAGEAAGPESIWKAIRLLGASRIGHGVAAIQDPALMAYMAENRIAVESCPTSNYQTATVGDLSKHPMPVFIQQGMCVTLNTDDPGVSNIDINHEYRVAEEVLGLTPAQLGQIQRNGVEAAFLSESDKQTLVANADK